MDSTNQPEEASPDQKSIRVKLDSVFTIDLACNAGAGYSWQLTDSSQKALQYIKQEFKNTSDKDGADGIQTFYFKALQKEKVTIRLVYVQPYKKPWPASAPAKTFLVDIY